MVFVGICWFLVNFERCRLFLEAARGIPVEGIHCLLAFSLFVSLGHKPKHTSNDNMLHRQAVCFEYYVSTSFCGAYSGRRRSGFYISY